MSGDDSVNTQNMLIRDNNAGQVDSRGTNMDPTRSVGFMQDTTLSEFFQRPVKILETDWSVASPLFVRFNPWKLFWENPRNLEKISNYFLLKCTMHVKLLINGNAFYYGRAIMAYEPLASQDNTSATATLRPSAYTQDDLVRLSQRMHIYINPTECQGGSLELPFFWDKSSLLIPQNEWDQMGDCILMSMNDLAHANGGTDALTISVLAWAENVSYAIPTASTPTPPALRRMINKPEMADEHDMAVVSRPASTVARYARALTNIPWIGPFAKATEIGATAIAAVAKIFGYSSPTNLEYGIMVPTPRTSLAVVDTKYPTNKLSVDSKQEVTIDPATTGIDSTDELPIGSIASRESYLTSFDWNIGTAADTQLFQIRVDPMQRRVKGREYHFPACAAAVLPFEYWRGTMRFRFQIVSSSYHKGRIRIVYDPYAGNANPEFNTHYTTVHDISDEKDFTVDVGWAQNEPYRRPLNHASAGYNTSLTPLSGLDEYGNGVLSVYVLNGLTVPGTVVSNIQVNVFVSMLDDFEVAMPNANITNWRFRDPVPPAKLRNIPEMAEEQTSSDMDCCDTPVNDPPVINDIADTLIDTPETTKLFFGEVIGSFRQLLKRTTLAEVKRVPDDTASTYYWVERRAFPEFGGLYTGTTLNNGMPLQYSNGQLVVGCATTYLNYVSRMFLGWRGSIRWTLDCATLNVSGGSDRFNSVTITASRKNSTYRTYGSGPLHAAGEPDINIGPNLTDLGDFETAHGAHLINTNVNPIQSFEVPFYSNKRFYSTQREIPFSTAVEEPCFRISTILPGSSNNSDVSILKMYCSAGEDFNLFFFNGLPPLYYSAELPNDPGVP